MNLYKIQQERCGLGWSEGVVEAILTEKEIEELGYLTDELKETGKASFVGAHKNTFIRHA